MAEEVLGPGNYQPSEEGFSHQTLVMETYRKVIDLFCKEQKEGFWSERHDKNGNTIHVYEPDTRLAAIEAVKTLRIILSSQLRDSDYEKEIQRLLKVATEYKKKTIENQKSWFDSQTFENRQLILRRGIIPNKLTDKSEFYHSYLSWLSNHYRKILVQLELCISVKCKYFRSGVISA